MHSDIPYIKKCTKEEVAACALALAKCIKMKQTAEQRVSFVEACVIIIIIFLILSCK